MIQSNNAQSTILKKSRNLLQLSTTNSQNNIINQLEFCFHFKIIKLKFGNKVHNNSLMYSLMLLNNLIGRKMENYQKILKFSLIIPFSQMKSLCSRFLKHRLELNKKKKIVLFRLKMNKIFLRFLDLQKMDKFSFSMKTKNKNLLKVSE